MGGRTVNVEPGQTVLRAVQAAGIDWMHACGAKGRCTSCRMTVVSGTENLGPITAPEQRFLDNGRLRLPDRLTCQCTITGPVTARVPEATQLPHQVYNE